MTEVYFAQVRTHDPKTKRDRIPVLIPFLLPHEMLFAMIKSSKKLLDDLCDAPIAIKQLVKAFADKAGVDSEGIIALGFHGDGVPHQKNRSCQVFSWNLLAKPLAERLLFTVISKDVFVQLCVTSVLDYVLPWFLIIFYIICPHMFLRNIVF